VFLWGVPVGKTVELRDDVYWVLSELKTEVGKLMNERLSWSELMLLILETMERLCGKPLANCIAETKVKENDSS